jgi:hypothetical protein
MPAKIPAMEHDSELERQQLMTELDSVIDEMLGLTNPGWQFALGRIHVRRHVSSQTIFRVYMVANIALAISGVVLIFSGTGVNTELGVALVVGALFGIGAFGAAVWELTVIGERDAFRESFGDDVREEIVRLRSRRDELWEQIQALSPSDPD